MFVRLLMLLLLAANIGVATWLVLAQRQPAPRLPLTDPGVPPLVLLAERDRASRANEPEAPAPRPVRRDTRCTSLGPFGTQSDMRAAMNALTPAVERIQFRESARTQSYGHVVYLPAQPSREAALTFARELSARGVRDYYVVSSGDQQNTISLGLFRDVSNAQRRRAELAALGFNAQIAERTEARPEYFLDYAQAAARPVDWRTLLPDLRNVTARTIPCF
jgi:hypothetical protein